ncbi:1-aminocyclopropane-1-carboxylate deaminase [Lujinxingia litoralis]|uniref:1-aminocyclopropane-1-carboxylate deaminase n=1 Tax=Lujinxingia litoralis TaxID=2211119 RepID=A0A328CBV6_9DELT|nr:pyridoxal-phosphate dependent enzyme [Lujinxingia litoralis]RAL23627.1 1-aminocyclopropane-1-carboxylate deaminase [Lujinxingia litoralis]
MSELEIFERYPQTRALNHVSLCESPTPVDTYPALAAELGVRDLMVKRDDLTGKLYGGNKVRKLEFILADALAAGHRRVWTVGAVGSHHVLATALYARQVGLEPHALHFPQPVTPHVREVLQALSTTAPVLTLIESKNGLPFAMAKTHIREWLSRDKNPYFIPGGGSSPLGVIGYVNAALELAAQIERGECPTPDVLYVAAGTCGTLSGLALGAKMAGLPTKIVGVRVVDKVVCNVPLACHMANRAGDLLREAGVPDVPRIGAGDLTLLHDFFGAGYGKTTPEGRTMIERVALHTEFALEPTYTAKTFAAIAADAESLADKRVLYWHTLSGADLSGLLTRAQVDWDLPPEYQHLF